MTAMATPVRRPAPPKPSATLDRLIAHYRASVDEFVVRAQSVDDAHWNVPRAEGKWTPAQQAEHVGLAYGVIISDLERHEGFRVVVHGWKRWVIRFIYLPRILAGSFPTGARAPREVRPAAPTKSRAELLQQLRDNAERALELAVDVLAREPGRTCAHPYFGALSVRQMLIFASVHTLHHADFLPAAGPATHTA